MTVLTPEVMMQVEVEAELLAASEQMRMDMERVMSYLSSARRYGGKPVGVTKRVYDAIMASGLFEVVGTPTNKEYTFAYGADVYSVKSETTPTLTCVSRAYVGTSGRESDGSVGQQLDARQLLGVSDPRKKDNAVAAVICGLMIAAPVVLYGLGFLG